MSLSKVLLSLFTIIFCFQIHAQLLYTENFESSGQDGTNYRTNAFNDGGGDVWIRWNVDSSAAGPNPSGTTSGRNFFQAYSGQQGNYAFGGEDMDASDNPLGTGNAGYFVTKTLDVSSYQGDSIRVTLLMGASTELNSRFESSDYFLIEAAFDSDIASGANSVGGLPTVANVNTGTYTIFGAYYGGAGATSTNLTEDTDLNGAANTSANELGVALEADSFAIEVPNTATKMSIRLACLGASAEEMVFDYVRVRAVSGGTTCSMSASITSSTNIACNGESTGAMTVTASGGTANYDYSWSNFSSTSNTSSTTNSITNLPATTYTVTVTDNNGCTATASETLTQNTAVGASASISSAILCNGGTGNVTVTPSGGTGVYTYNWNTGETNQTETGVTADTYSVTVTDGNGCTDSSTVTITQNTAVGASASISSAILCNGGTGNVTVTPSGGTGGYTYNWNTGETAQTETGVLADTYSVTVTDGFGCTDSSTVTLTQNTAVGASASISSAILCNGGTGNVTVTPSGGTGGYTYNWNTGETNQTETGVLADTYSVTVTDGNGCTDSSTVTLTQNTAVGASASISSAILCNGGTGNVTVTPSGGTGGYTYNWNTGETAQTETGVLADTYSVTVTDGFGCTDSSTVTITQNTAVGASASISSAILCNGGTGNVTVTPSGGTGGYTYNWNTGETAQTETGVSADTYSVTVTDGFGCTDSSTITITQPTALTASTTLDSNTTCGAFDGGATASATGGTGSYTYNWSNSATTASITGVAAGTYSVTITDAFGCTDSTALDIADVGGITSSAIVDSNVTCNTFSDGGATASATGGTGSFTYNWSNSATTASITGVTAGTYSVTITDQAGCTDSSSVAITEPVALTALTVADSNVSCNTFFDGGATAAATGGTGSYTYNWSNSAVTASITGVAAGTYSVTITDQNGCTDSASVTITQPASLVASGVVDSNATCSGFFDGGATASATGGTGSYTYNWSNSASTASITGVPSGTYSVTITDQNGCTDSASVTITQPNTILALAIVDSNVTCNSFSDGGATASSSGITGITTYLWSNSATTASITGVVAGTYSITVSDANGCTDSTSVTITEPAALVASSIVDSNISCNGETDGGITASATGGTGAYTYNWSNSAVTASITGLPGGTYSVTITDQNGCTDSASSTVIEPVMLVAASIVDSNASCNGFFDGGATASATGGTGAYTYNWSNSATTASITGVPATTYSVTITDQNGCTDSSSVTITEPTAISAAAVIDSNVTCNSFSDGGATASATGGTGAYTYNWSNSATTASITGVVAGTYSVTITDQNGCTDSTSATVTEPAALVASSIVDSNISCNSEIDGGATASATGGTMPYTYNWSNAATTASITGAAAGTYSVTITDLNGCTDSASVTITEPAVLVSASIVDSNVSCNTFSDGGATASATGGTMPYTYNWSNSAITASITGVVAGTYSVTITDQNGCTDSSSITITEPAVLVSASIVDSNVSCNSFSDGGATASATGGTMPYTYNWSNSATTASITGVVAGTYSVTITDHNGCTDSSSTTITEPAILVSSTVVDSNTSCNGDSDGGATASATGGTMPYTYNWSNAATTASITGLAAGTYSVTITDQNGCTDSASVVVTEPAVLSLSVTLDSNESCVSAMDGGLTATPTGGTPVYTYDWINTTTTTASITGIAAGSYSVIVTDANGCTATGSESVIVEDVTPPTVVVQDINAYLDGSGSITVLASEVDNGTFDACGIASTSIDVSTFNCSNIGPNTVVFTAVDVNGNSDSSNVTITVLDTNSPVMATQNVTIYLDANGEATTTAVAIDNGTADNCGIASISLDSTDFDCSEVGANTVTLTATDINGNTNTATATVTVMDTLDPIMVVQNTTIYLDANGQASVTAAAVDNGTNDNCGIATLELDSTNFDCSEAGPNMVTLTATDVNGNVSTATAFVTVLDTIAPSLIVNNDTSVCATDGSGTVVSFANLTDDNCGVGSITQTAGLPSGSTFPIGTTVNTFLVIDVNGNATVDSFTVEVFDFPVLSIDEVGILCETADAVQLQGQPAGGTFSGPGVAGSEFDPTAVDAGNQPITYTFVTAENCSYSTTIFADVRLNPDVNLGEFGDSVCIEFQLVAAPVATPSGGVYSGPGIDSITLETAVAGLGEHTITYTFEDEFGCVGSDSTIVEVIQCFEPAGIAGIEADGARSVVYPNPNRGTFTVKHDLQGAVQGKLFSARGELVMELNRVISDEVITLDQIGQGVFFLQISGPDLNEIHRIIIQ